jgi:hypothetical protein
VQVRWQALRGAVVRLLVSLPESLCPSRLLEPKRMTLSPRSHSLNRPDTSLGLRAMVARRLIRWVLLVIPVLTIGMHGPLVRTAAAASPQGTSSGAQSFVSAPRQSLPLPVHNEATCAFCQAAAFAPYRPLGTGALPVSLATERREVLSEDHRLTHSGSVRPPRSRAPPVPRFV